MAIYGGIKIHTLPDPRLQLSCLRNLPDAARDGWARTCGGRGEGAEQAGGGGGGGGGAEQAWPNNPSTRSSKPAPNFKLKLK